MTCHINPLLFALSLLVATFPSAAQAIPEWFAKPSAVASPTGVVVLAATVEQILQEGEKLAAGGTLLIEPGVYKLTRPMVLRARRDITIRSESGDPASVTLMGKGWDAGNDRDDILHISDCDGVRIAGLTFAEARSYGVKVEAEHAPRNVHIYNCRFRNIGVRAIKGSAAADPSIRAVNGSVRHCDFENTKVPPADWLFGGDYIAAIDMMALDDWTFADNTFRNIKGRNGGGRAAIFIWVRSRNIRVERNIIVDCDRGIAFGNPGQSTANQPGAQLSYVANGTIQNNFIAGGADCGIELWHVEEINVWHNSIWRPDRNFGRGIRVGAGTVRGEIANNLVHGGIQMEGGRTELHHNLATRLDGYFMDPAKGDLSLKETAVDAIDKGVQIPSIPRDISRLNRRNAPDLGAWEFNPGKNAWIEPMRKVHARFKGKRGSYAQFGDSITYSGAFWSPLAGRPRNMTPAEMNAHRTVTRYLVPETFAYKGPEFGNQGSMTIRWAEENISTWLVKLNPEVAVILFGSNDYRQMDASEYERAVRNVVEKCVANGTVPLLTTPPPQNAHIEKSHTFAEVIRRVAAENHLPLIDYAAEILERRPRDWNGATGQFKDVAGDTYNVRTLISRDGVHPSNPKQFENDFSREALDSSGYTLRNYLTLLSYAEVIQKVLE